MLRLGLVDFDSSHVIEFTRRFNHVGVAPDQYVDGARVVLGWPGTSAMAPERIPGFQQQVVDAGVELVDAPEDMLGRIDAVLVLSLSGMPHLERVRPFLEAGVPAFVDKPFACSVADAEEMIRLAQQQNVVLFNSSGLRFSAEIQQFQSKQADYGRLLGMVSFGPAKRAAGNPGLFHYGIHPTEMMFTLMGPGCEWVSTAFTEDADVCTAGWRDGRLANLRGNRQGSTAYGFVAFCEHAVVPQFVSAHYAYRNLCRAIVKTLETGEPAVAHEESLEIVKFIAASLESERRGGERIALDSLKS